jgi:hypothetical protein
MRLTLLVAVLISCAPANPYFDPDPANPETGVLVIWPTARSTALAGAMTGLADEADATYFNPSGLAFQTTAKADVTHSIWLPGLYPGMYYESAAGGSPVQLPFLPDRRASIAGSATYMTMGETDVVNERGDFLGRYSVWRGVLSVSSAVGLVDRLAVGLTVKGMHVHLTPDWYWQWGSGLGEMDGTANALAFDAGTLFRPSTRFSLGVSLANLGPWISYSASGERDQLPAMLRLGACWTPVQTHAFSLRILPELDKLLVGTFHDTAETFGHMLGEEWRDVWKAVGIEAKAFNFASLRLGYLEDLSFQRGGVVLEDKEGTTYHYGLWDALSRKGLGQVRSIGLCWGLGFGTNRLRFDLSSDAAIYDFPTSNWKFQVTCNDIGRLFGKRG